MSDATTQVAAAPAAITDSATVAEGTFTPEQEAKIAEWMSEKGIDLPGDGEPHPDGGSAALTAEQPADGQISTVPVPDAFGGEVKAVDYKFAQVEGDGAMPLQDQISIRNVLCAEGIPKSTGDALAILWNHEVRQPPKSDALLEAEGRSAAMALDRKHGPDRAAQILKDARSEARRLALRSPLIKHALETTGLGNSVILAEMLANLAQARRSR